MSLHLAHLGANELAIVYAVTAGLFAAGIYLGVLLIRSVSGSGRHEGDSDSRG